DDPKVRSGLLSKVEKQTVRNSGMQLGRHPLFDIEVERASSKHFLGVGDDKTFEFFLSLVEAFSVYTGIRKNMKFVGMLTLFDWQSWDCFCPISYLTNATGFKVPMNPIVPHCESEGCTEETFLKRCKNCGTRLCQQHMDEHSGKCRFK